MAQRIKIGLIYSYNKDWVAGAYYILNLIHALKQQPDSEKPELIILSHSADEYKTVEETGYPYLTFVKLEEKDFWASYNLAERSINKLWRILFKKNIFYREQTQKRLKAQPDVLFPATRHIYFSNIPQRLFWIPDFQEHFLPQFFTEQDLKDRKKYQSELTTSNTSIVFSSNNALQHFKEIYPQSAANTFVLPFAVTHPAYDHLEIDALRKKFNISGNYFFCPNQFWAHKNHITVLKAIRSLKEQGINDFIVAFSGKESDYRNPDFFTGLKKYVAENGIEEQVRFLGFIDRDEQLQLMNHAISVIQPSLFEGWSTVVEDAKAMSQFVIASGLPVHREQLAENAVFFDPLDAHALAQLMKAMIETAPQKVKNNYAQQVIAFGKTFVDITKQLRG